MVLKKKILAIGILVIFISSCFSIQMVSAQPAGVSAQAYVLLDANTGTMLAGSNEREQLPMASTTKIMTTLLTLEQPELDESFVVDSEAIKVEGTSMGLLPGDLVTLRDLSYGMLLSSGNDAANLAAIRIAGSIEKFADKMNERARQIGMNDSYFVTPSGLHDDKHVSTAYDMALLAKEALKNEDFLAICSAPKAKLSFGNPPYVRWLSNHNKMLGYYEGCIGMKTGFTKAAGRCLVSAVERRETRLICVTLNAPNDWQDHSSLFDYGLSIANEGKRDPSELAMFAEYTTALVGGEQENITVKASGKADLTAEQRKSLEQKVLLRSFYYAPVKIGDVLGTLQYIQDGQVLAEEDLVAQALF